MFSIIQAAGWPIWPLILCSVAALTLQPSSVPERGVAPASPYATAASGRALVPPSERGGTGPASEFSAPLGALVVLAASGSATPLSAHRVDTS